jgi:hypothetical protein
MSSVEGGGIAVSWREGTARMNRVDPHHISRSAEEGNCGKRR